MTIKPLFGNYNPNTFGWSEGQFTPYSYKGVAFPQGLNSAHGVSVVFTHMLDALVPHIPGGLVAGQCWGADTADRVHNSFHLYGLAIDINAPENPQTGNAHSYGSEYELSANTGDIVKPFGFEWGGDWSQNTPPDYMHLECHLTPADMITLANALVHTVAPTGPWSPWAVIPAAHRTVHQGDDGTDVEQLQTVLNKWYPHLTELTVDGYDGPLTTSRVRYLQTRAGITVDGIVGRDTWRSLGFVVGY